MACEVTMELLDHPRASLRRLLGRLKDAEVDALSKDLRLSLELAVACCDNPFETLPGVGAAVASILGCSANPQVLSAIVESVVVYVVNHLSAGWAKNSPAQKDAFLFAIDLRSSAHAVVRLDAVGLLGNGPLVPLQKGGIVWRDENNKTHRGSGPYMIPAGTWATIS